LTGFKSQFEAPSLADLEASDWMRGCLAEGDPERGRAPDFAWDATARQALRAWARMDWGESLGRETPAEFAERQTANLRCNACHARDGVPDFWSRLTTTKAAPVENDYGEEEDAASGSVHLGRPELTLAGEKLHGEWMQRLLGGTLGYKARPEAQGRMPAFGAVAEGLGAGMAHQHGLGASKQPRPAANPSQAAAGQKLTRIEGGFGCVSCHGVGTQAALAGPDTATINFAFVADRLRPEYFRRYVRDPQRFRPGTMMPSFIAEDGSTPIKGVLDGNATEQFDAIWQYLLSLEPAMAAP
jgi:cytochrome c553